VTRGLVEDLDTPHPLWLMLPGLFQEDGFAGRLCGALDQVLAPVLSTLDCLDAYLDPDLTPVDFLDWLAGWVGIMLDQNWPESRRRALVGRAGELYRWQGTARGIAEHVALYTGVLPEISDSGGAAYSEAPDGPLPGRPMPEIVVRVRVADPGSIDLRHLEAIVVAAKPAHVAHQVEVAGS
jgi:phage tail-like protein